MSPELEAVQLRTTSPEVVNESGDMFAAPVFTYVGSQGSVLLLAASVLTAVLTAVYRCLSSMALILSTVYVSEVSTVSLTSTVDCLPTDSYSSLVDVLAGSPLAIAYK